MVRKFEELEQALLGKGAKTFKEIHPNWETEERQTHNYGYQPYERPPFEIKFHFSAYDLTDHTRDAYAKL
jgi:hypothetical protein